jgi:uncharacterized membrane protein YdjX (TVP38/TMEM64 family)
MGLFSNDGNHKQARRILVMLVVVILFWSILLYNYSPEEIVSWLGVENGYALLFLISLFGGVSAVTAGSYFGVLLTLAAGGLDPLLLALVSGSAATVGDTMFYYLGRQGRASVEHGRMYDWLMRVSGWLNKRPAWNAPVLLYLLAAFTPVPNDVTAAVMGLASRSWLTTVIPLVLGNITLTFMIAYLGHTFW